MVIAPPNRADDLLGGNVVLGSVDEAITFIAEVGGHRTRMSSIFHLRVFCKDTIQRRFIGHGRPPRAIFIAEGANVQHLPYLEEPI